MAFVNADWSIDRDVTPQVIDYIGDTHTGAAPTYATVLEFHRGISAFADDATSAGDDEHDITDPDATDKSFDTIIRLLAGYTITEEGIEHLYGGSIIQEETDTIWDGIQNFGNADVQIQIIQDGALLVGADSSTDHWNKSFPSGTSTGGADSLTLTDSGETWTTDEWAGYTVYNTTDGSEGIILSNTSDTLTLTSNGLHGGTDNDFDNGDAYVIGAPMNGDANAGISHQFLVKVREDGADIDGRRLVGVARRFNNTYSEFVINGTGRGNNTLALKDADDIFNNSTASDISGTGVSGTPTTAWVITNDTEGFIQIDITGDATVEDYYSDWNDTVATGTNRVGTVNDIFEYAKWQNEQNTSETLYGLNGTLFRGPTMQIPYDGLSGTFTELGDVAWGVEIAYDNEGAAGLTVGKYYEFSDDAYSTIKAVGQLLALDDNGTAGFAIFDIEDQDSLADDDVFRAIDLTANEDAIVNATITTNGNVGGRGRILADNTTDTMWIQLLKGVAPVNNQPIWECTTAGVYDNATGDNALVNGTPTDRVPLLKTPFIGTSTGSNIIGGYGIGFDTASVGASDQAFDLDNTQNIPPNNVTFTLTNLIVTGGADRILVGPEDGAGGLDYDQLGLNATLSTDLGGGAGQIVMDTTIPSDTPTAGYIRVLDDNGRYRRISYDAWSGSTFDIDEPAAGEADFSSVNATAGNNVFVAYMDRAAASASENFSGVNLNRTLFIRVRNAAGTIPIKPFTSTANVTNADASVSVTRISDA